ncbi:TetR/AcrR family transcriptional regulator [Kibdelosporangium phytohabitans]|uniref:Transcriptional regulator n=1 Tax=Kibdelosporangium phytohabitans TaxID=860235 RepID=A0A0N7F4U5_9PSEU|nr:TetR/AcrR family transcriptional regulator [Kibdelosporangium phytohabitans]ALG12407.1 transcriptional regulator [Kibdelosporangium phytohabitans]MBE1463990.1 AcrR family transcriptional regulator [Kibdelosporangium phytohabitans]
MRADAARNKEKVLSAAALLFATKGARNVTMADIAQAADVGRATLYRRYPDVASIATALLDAHEHELQEQLLRGDPPLGPGAAPAERLTAFYAAMVELLEQHHELVLGTEVGQSRLRTGAYGFWRAHVRSLLVAAQVPEADALADSLLAPLAPDVYTYQRKEHGLSTKEIIVGLERLAHGVLGGGE